MSKESPKPKSKSTLDGLSKFERAQKLFQDIETIIEQELANTPIIAAEANYAKIKKSKRKRPGLIRNFNSKKNRLVIGGMEFDPDTLTWLGNEEALSAFSPQQPALITNYGKHDKTKVVGKMIWDPKDLKWKGNEKDAMKFSPRKPALITQKNLGGSSYLQKEVSGMVFDPITMRWIGNDTAVDIFAQIDSLDDSGFTVGNEFHLPPALTKSFTECANKHRATLSGWFADSNMDKKSHLYAIRNMSILRVVRDVKQRKTTYVDVDDDLVPERDIPTPSPRDINSGNGNNTDTENYDDLQFNGSARLKLPEVGVGTDDWDRDFDDDFPTPPLSAKDDSSNKPTLNGTLKKEAEEDWDSDFAAAAPEAFSKLKAMFGKKPFQETGNRGSIIDLRERRNTQAQKPKPAPIEEDEDGFDLPPGPILLSPKPKPHAATSSGSGESGFDDESSSSSRGRMDHGKLDDTEDDYEEEEEDWTDVDVPASLPSQPVLKPHQDREDWDNDADIEIPSSKLTLKPRTRVSDDDDDEENLLAGVEIPENFAVRLRK